MIEIRSATASDLDAMWEIFAAVVAAGDAYVFGPDATRADAQAYWFGSGISSYVATRSGRVLGMYKLLANQRDRGAHVANASFMVDPLAQGQGAGEALARHCLDAARAAGFDAMQFNFVVSTNTGAIRLWQRLGFRIVGTLPQAFRHAQLGYVDAYVMHRFLHE